MERIISLEQKPKLRRNITIGGQGFEINGTDAQQIQYISRVCFPSAQFHAEQGLNPVRITGVRKEFEEFDQLPKPDITQGHQFYGRTAEGLEFTGSTYFRYCVISSQRSNTHLSISSYPEYSILSLIKLHLLKEYSEKYAIATVFHAGAVVSDHSCVVLASPDSGEPENKRFGKTSTIMALCSQTESGFNLFSNDEVVLGTNGKVIDILPFPNEIPIKQVTIDTNLKDRQPSFEEWTEESEIPGETIRTVTSVGLVKSGIRSEVPNNIRQWIFLNMSADTQPNVVTKLGDSEALRQFKLSVFNRRMRQMKKTPIGALEQDHLFQSIIADGNYQDGVGTMFDIMKSSGVTFWELKGGFDPSEIRKSVLSLKDK